VKKKLVKLSLCVSAVFSANGALSGEVARSQDLQPKNGPREQVERLPSPRYLAEKFKNITLSHLRLEGDIARNAMDKLNLLDFYCTLVGEGKNVLNPQKPFAPFVKCEQLIKENENIVGAIVVDMSMKDWSGDGTPMNVRYEQLSTATVFYVSGAGIPYSDNRQLTSAKEESHKLDEALVIATPGQSVSEVVKYAMLQNISCKTTKVETEKRTALDCVALGPSRGCVRALISIDVAQVTESSLPLSLWSKDWHVKGQQGPWICLNTRNGN
jgi:hypothetical protein